MIAERDILGTQLIKRSDELKDLFEKIKLQQSTLKKGEIQYKERVRRGTPSAQKLQKGW